MFTCNIKLQLAQMTQLMKQNNKEIKSTPKSDEDSTVTKIFPP